MVINVRQRKNKISPIFDSAQRPKQTDGNLFLSDILEAGGINHHIGEKTSAEVIADILFRLPLPQCIDRQYVLLAPISVIKPCPKRLSFQRVQASLSFAMVILVVFGRQIQVFS